MVGIANGNGFKRWGFSWLSPPVIIAMATPVAMFIIWDYTSNVAVQRHETQIGELFREIYREQDARRSSREELQDALVRRNTEIASLHEGIVRCNLQIDILSKAVTKLSDRLDMMQQVRP